MAIPGGAQRGQGAGSATVRAGDRIAAVAGSEPAQVGASVLTRRITSEMGSLEYPEDEYFRQYVTNPYFPQNRR